MFSIRNETITQRKHFLMFITESLIGGSGLAVGLLHAMRKLVQVSKVQLLQPPSSKTSRLGLLTKEYCSKFETRLTQLQKWIKPTEISYERTLKKTRTYKVTHEKKEKVWRVYKIFILINVKFK